MWIKTPEQQQFCKRHYSGERCTGRDYKFTYQQASADLTPVTSHLEGVGYYLAACAAITLVHYTPPPFIAIIVHCNSNAVKIFLQFIVELEKSLYLLLASQATSITSNSCKNLSNLTFTEIDLTKNFPWATLS
jgi:hypothetical protein